MVEISSSGSGEGPGVSKNPGLLYGVDDARAAAMNPGWASDQGPTASALPPCDHAAEQIKIHDWPRSRTG